MLIGNRDVRTIGTSGNTNDVTSRNTIWFMEIFVDKVGFLRNGIS